MSKEQNRFDYSPKDAIFTFEDRERSTAYRGRFFGSARDLADVLWASVEEAEQRSEPITDDAQKNAGVLLELVRQSQSSDHGGDLVEIFEATELRDSGDETAATMGRSVFEAG